MALANEAKQLRADTERLASRENADAEQLQSARQVFELQLDDTKQQLNLAQLRNGSLSQENRILYEENAKMAELLEAVRQDPGMQVGARSGPSMPALYVQFCDRRMALGAQGNEETARALQQAFDENGRLHAEADSLRRESRAEADGLRSESSQLREALKTLETQCTALEESLASATELQLQEAREHRAFGHRTRRLRAALAFRGWCDFYGWARVVEHVCGRWRSNLAARVFIAWSGACTKLALPGGEEGVAEAGVGAERTGALQPTASRRARLPYQATPPKFGHRTAVATSRGVLCPRFGVIAWYGCMPPLCWAASRLPSLPCRSWRQGRDGGGAEASRGLPAAAARRSRVAAAVQRRPREDGGR